MTAGARVGDAGRMFASFDGQYVLADRVRFVFTPGREEDRRGDGHGVLQ